MLLFASAAHEHLCHHTTWVPTLLFVKATFFFLSSIDAKERLSRNTEACTFSCPCHFTVVALLKSSTISAHENCQTAHQLEQYPSPGNILPLVVRASLFREGGICSEISPCKFESSTDTFGKTSSETPSELSTYLRWAPSGSARIKHSFFGY